MTQCENKGKPWSARDDEKLLKMARDGVSIDDMAAHFKRNRSAILSRIQRRRIPCENGNGKYRTWVTSKGGRMSDAEATTALLILLYQHHQPGSGELRERTKALITRVNS